MNTLSNNKLTLLFGVSLGIDATILMAIMMFTDLYLNPNMVWIFMLIIPLQLLTIIAALKMGTNNGNTYRDQIMLGLKVSLLAGLIAAGTSYLFTTTLKPTYFADIKAMGQQIYAKNPTPEMAAQIEQYNSMATPELNSLSGFLGSTICGFLMSLIVAAFLRKK